MLLNYVKQYLKLSMIHLSLSRDFWKIIYNVTNESYNKNSENIEGSLMLSHV